MNFVALATVHETQSRRWTTFTPPRTAAHAALHGLFLLRRSQTGPMQTIEKVLEKLKDSASTANLAADRWRMFTRTFRWQQLAIAILAGILIGAVGHWYFVTRGPETEAAEYILFLKHGMAQKAAQAPSSAGSPVKPQRGSFGAKPKPHSKLSDVPTEEAPGVSSSETAEPPQ